MTSLRDDQEIARLTAENDAYNLEINRLHRDLDIVREAFRATVEEQSERESAEERAEEGRERAAQAELEAELDAEIAADRADELRYGTADPLPLRIRFYVGIGTTDGLSPEEAADHVIGKIVGQYDGGTFTRTEGAWRSASGNLVREESIVAEVVTLAARDPKIHRDIAAQTAEELAQLLDQETVLFTVERLVSAEFTA